MSNGAPKPVIQLIPTSQGGGFRVSFSGQPDMVGSGATIELALQALSARIASQYASEKGDETAAAQDAARQTDILASDRFIRGNDFQGTVLLAAAIGLI